MTGHEPLDDAVRAWVRSGPEAASAEFVERTLRPIPRMRQRRAWRIAMDRVADPTTRLAGMAAVVAIAVAAGVFLVGITGLGGVGLGSGPSSGPARPSFRLDVGGGTGAGTYRSDPTPNLSMCTHNGDGSWRFLYVGGQPAVNLDMLVGSGASTTGSADVAVEVDYGPGYVRFDPADLRGGDPAGRSTATVTVSHADGLTTFVVAAMTPDTSTGADAERIRVDLTVTCPT
jgi:hypothetical protein